MPKPRPGARQQIKVVPGRAWHYMRGCRMCGAWAEYLPRHEGRCARHGGRGARQGREATAAGGTGLVDPSRGIAA